MKHINLILVLLMFLSCKQNKKYHDTDQNETSTVQIGAVQAIFDFQRELNEEFKNPETSPLSDRFRKDFEQLNFFEPDTTYIVQAKFVRTPEAIPFSMPTTTDRKSTEVVYGIAYFSLKGEEHKLEIYQNKELILQEEYKAYLFLPFADQTNGEETYTGGRYIDLSIPDSDTIVLDFNRAYNPYCAYNKKYSCPLVPSVNNLDVRIRAGVKAFKKGYN